MKTSKLKPECLEVTFPVIKPKSCLFLAAQPLSSALWLLLLIQAPLLLTLHIHNTLYKDKIFCLLTHFCHSSCSKTQLLCKDLFKLSSFLLFSRCHFKPKPSALCDCPQFQGHSSASGCCSCPHSCSVPHLHTPRCVTLFLIRLQ